MSFESFSSFACRCDDKLDLYEQFSLSTTFNLFYRRSSAVDDGDTAASSQWFITPLNLGVHCDAVATWQNEVFEIVRESATYYLSRYSTASQSVAWSKTLSGTYPSSAAVMHAGPDHTGVARHYNGDSYEIWDADGNLDYRDGFTEGVGFSPRLSDYTTTEVKEGETPIPTCVSRWNYPACIGWRIADITISAWAFNGFSYRASGELTYQLVAGNVDWTVEDGPVMSAGTVLEEYFYTNAGLFPFQQFTAPAGLTTDEERDTWLKETITKRLNGDAVISVQLGDFYGSCEVWPASIRSSGVSVASERTLGHFNRNGSGVVGYEKHQDGTHGYLRFKNNSEYEVRVNGSLVDTLDTGIVFISQDVPYSFTSVPSDDLAFVVTWRSRPEVTGTGTTKIRAYDNVGDLAWEFEADSTDGRGQAMCASDRYVYVAFMPFDWAEKIGVNLPVFTDGAKGPQFDAEYWTDWAISLDGTRFNPVRHAIGGQYLERFSSPVASLGHVDCIKNSDAIPFCPPDDWF